MFTDDPAPAARLTPRPTPPDTPTAQTSGIFLLACVGVYISQTLVTTLATQSLPSLLRSAGVPLQLVGLSYLFLLPWVVKFLWSPAIERLRRPAAGRDHSRRLIVSGQLLLALVLSIPALIALTGEPLMQLSGVLLLLAALLSASVDVAADGMMIDRLRSSNGFGRGNVIQVGGSYLGVMLGSGGFLLLAGYLSWPLALLLSAVFLVLISLPLAALPGISQNTDSPGNARTDSGSRPSLRHALQRREIRHALLLVLLMGAGIRTAFGMLGPVLLDHGISMTQLGWLFSSFSVIAGLLGTVAGGWLSRFFQPWQAVGLVLLFQALSLAAFIPALELETSQVLISVCGITFAAMAAGFVVIYSALMRLTSPAQPGVDFTLFQCTDALIAMTGGIAGGLLAGQLGYIAYFAIAAGLSLLAALMVLRISVSSPPGLSPPMHTGDPHGTD